MAGKVFSGMAEVEVDGGGCVVELSLTGEDALRFRVVMAYYGVDDPADAVRELISEFYDRFNGPVKPSKPSSP
ncbi:MAG: hypothetical protein QXG35_00535 [Nitrososphaerota archaeon]